MLDALIETTIARDVLLLTRVDKPALLRRLFELGCRYSGQVLSYTKMLGQLQDAGNTTTLAHYLELLAGAGMLTGLQKYAGDPVRQRGSSPKLQVLNTALMTAQSGLTPRRGPRATASSGDAWSNPRSVRIWPTPRRAVCASSSTGARATAKWTSWCVAGTVGHRGEERRPPGVTAGHVRIRGALRGTGSLLVGGDGIPLGDFLSRPVEELIA